MEHLHPQDDPLIAPEPQPVPATPSATDRLRSRGHVRSFPGGRTCGADACDTVLSRYNDAVLCSLHAAARLRLRP